MLLWCCRRTARVSTARALLLQTLSLRFCFVCGSRPFSMGDFNQNIACSETYDPPKELSANAHVKSMAEYEAMWKASLEEPEKFWGDMAKQFYWQTAFERVGPEFNFDRSKGPISVKWFHGGTTNLSYNCLDRNIQQGHGSRLLAARS